MNAQVRRRLNRAIEYSRIERRDTIINRHGGKFETWLDWIDAIYPQQSEFAEHHIELWDWVWAMQDGERPKPYVAIWPRGGAKSSTAELAAAMVGALGKRKYLLYVRETQERADESISNIATLLESDAMAKHYPGMSERQVGKFGNARGWRRNRVSTASGFTADAMGLDAAMRSIKLDNYRPDFIIGDDLDRENDSPMITAKKSRVLRKALFPAGSKDVAILMLQNLIIPHGIFAQLASGEADFLARRTVNGPIPAIRNLSYEQRDGRYIITGGEATWAGQSLEVCQSQIDDWGLSAFLEESQHIVTEKTGGIWDHIEYQHVDFDALPDILDGVVACDPAVSNTAKSDHNGIQADALGADRRLYRVFSWEQKASPETTIKTALRKCCEYGFPTVVIENNQGGDLWRPAYYSLANEMLTNGEIKYIPEMRGEKATAALGSKVVRNQRMLLDYERGRVVHVRGTSNILEAALRRFPNAPDDLADSAYWGWYWLSKPDGERVTRIKYEPVEIRPWR